jgi:hypothetical protein
VGGRADEQFRLVCTRVEDRHGRAAAQRQPVDPPAGSDSDLADLSALLNRSGLVSPDGCSQRDPAASVCARIHLLETTT